MKLTADDHLARLHKLGQRDTVTGLAELRWQLLQAANQQDWEVWNQIRVRLNREFDFEIPAKK